MKALDYSALRLSICRNIAGIPQEYYYRRDVRTIRLSIRIIVEDVGDAQGKISQYLRLFREMLRLEDDIRVWKVSFHHLKLTCQDKKVA